MPSSPTIKGDNTVIWGSGAVYATGIITRGNAKTTGEKFLVKDNNGFTVTAIYFDDRNECSFEMIVQTAAADLERGDFITVGGITSCIVEECEKIWEQGGVMKFAVTAVKYSQIAAA